MNLYSDNQVQLQGNNKLFLPLGIDVSKLKCLVVGGGRIAARKVRTLLNSNAGITIVSPEVVEVLSDFHRDGVLEWITAEYSSEIVENFDIVIAATDDAAVNHKIAEDASVRNKLHCVVSSGKASQIIFPAVYKKGNTTVAIHSNGTNCKYSQSLRDRVVGLLEGNSTDINSFSSLSFDRDILSHDSISKLDRFSEKIRESEELRGNIAILSTCRRWNCYFYGNNIRALKRNIIDELKFALDNQWDNLKDVVSYETGHNVYYQLLRIVTGLASSLIGEQEIVSQVRLAVSSWLSDEKTELAGLFHRVMIDSKKIRDKTQITRPNNSWSGHITNAIRSVIGCDTGHLLIIGNGRLSRQIISEVKLLGFDITIVSKYSQLQEQIDGDRMVRVVSAYQKQSFEQEPSAVIVCSSLAKETEDMLLESNWLKQALVLDFEGYSKLFTANKAAGLYLDQVAVSNNDMTPVFVYNVSRAELLAYEFAMRWYSSKVVIKTPNEKLRIGARKSELSKSQLKEPLAVVFASSGFNDFEIEYFDTPGDRDRMTSLTKVLDGDFFTRDIDQALIDGDIDIAVHSAKDMPEKLRKGLIIAAVTPAIAPWEAVVSRDDATLDSLVAGARVGTSSLRRQEQLVQLRADIVPVDIRGDVPNRIKQLDEGKYDAIILAVVGLIRLGLTDRITQVLNDRVFPYSAGQSSLAIVVRKDDSELLEFFAPYDLGKG